MDVIEFGLLGDSSIYTKRANKKKSWVSSQLRPHLPGKLHVQAFYGGGVKELKGYLEQGRVFETLGISYFGCEHTDRPMNKSMYFNLWKELFKLLRKYVLKRVIFFMGGYAAKYGYCQAYDDNMCIIRKWIRDVGGFEVRTDFARVQTWPLAADKVHFDVECLPQLAEFWKQLLLKLPNPNKSRPQPPPGPPPKRCYEESSGQAFSKRARVSEEGRHYSHHVPPKDGVNICISDDDADDSPGNESWYDSGPRKASFSWPSRANPRWRGDTDITISDESGEDWQPRMQSWKTNRQTRYERNGTRGSVSKSESPRSLRPHPPHRPPPRHLRGRFQGSVSDAESDWLPPAEASRYQRYNGHKRSIASTHLGASSLPAAPSYPSRW